jgi:hypothetical protein
VLTVRTSEETSEYALLILVALIPGDHIIFPEQTAIEQPLSVLVIPREVGSTVTNITFLSSNYFLL